MNDKPRTVSADELLEDVCKLLIAHGEPIRFEVAKSPDELEAVYRLRYREVIERGWAEPNDFPDGLEQDIYDERAIQIAGWHGEALAATIRVVMPNPNHLLPTESAFDLRMEPRGKIVDVGR